MLTNLDQLDLSSGSGEIAMLSDDVEREITALLRARAPEMSAKNNFLIAASLVDSAAMTITTLQNRVGTLEAERDKLSAQEAEWELLLNKWRDMVVGLKTQIQDLEGKVAQANQRAIKAEVRARNAEEEVSQSQQGSLDLCDQVIAVLGTSALVGYVAPSRSEVTGNC